MAFQVGDYVFETRREAEAAEKERQAVAYVRQHLDLNDRKKVRDLYEKLLEDRTFCTAVGEDFLAELREILKETPQEDRADGTEREPQEDRADGTKGKPQENRAGRAGQKKAAMERQLRKYRRLSRIFGVASAAMLVMILGMFYITADSKNPTILNYEQKLIDKYASWETELTQRERELAAEKQELQKQKEQMEQTKQTEGGGPNDGSEEDPDRR